MKLIAKPVDMSKVRKIIYHMPEGEIFVVDSDYFEHSAEFGCGDVCDTSEINGELHFFPKGNA